MFSSSIQTRDRKGSAWSRFFLLVCVGVTAGIPSVQAGRDPLDERDGTESWNRPAEAYPGSQRSQTDEKASLRREVQDWEAIRTMWEDTRRDFVEAREEQKRWASRQRSPSSSNVSVPVQSRSVGGKKPKPHKSTFTGLDSTLDRAIDSELGETASPKGSSLAPTTGLDSPARRETELRQQTEQRQRHEEEVRRQTEEERLRNEESEGAAAADRLLKKQQEEQKREQEALRKKAKLQTDNEGQVVDPELKSEMDSDR